MCSSNILIFVASITLVLWGVKVLSTCVIVEDEDDDDSALIAFAHGVPFLLMGTMLLLLSSGKGETVSRLFTMMIPTEGNVPPLFVGVIILILALTVAHYKYIVPWRLARWARKRNLVFLSYKRSKRNLWMNALSGRSKYQSFYTVDLKDRSGKTLRAELVIGSYWGTNPNKIVVSWK